MGGTADISRSADRERDKPSDLHSQREAGNGTSATPAEAAPAAVSSFLTDPRLANSANLSRRVSAARTLQRAHGNAFVQRLMRSQAGQVTAHAAHPAEPQAGPAEEPESSRPAPALDAGAGAGEPPPRLATRGRSARPLPLVEEIRSAAPGAIGLQIQRQGAPAAAGGQPPDAAALLSAQYPNIQLTGEQVGKVQRILTARFELKKLEDELAPIAGSILSDDARKREAIFEKQRPHHDVLRDLQVVIPAAQVLGNDILPREKDIRGKEPAFREALYSTLIQYPVLGQVNEGLTPNPVFTYKWGPNRWPLGSDGGRVNWDQLMGVSKWNVAYHAALTGDMVDITQRLADITKELGGNLLDLSGKKLGETYGHFWNTTIKVRMEVGQITGYDITEPSDRAKLNVDWAKAQGAKLKVRAPDGYIHIYSLDNFTVLDMKEPGWDGYVYLLDKGTQVTGVQEVWTSDGRQLEACATEDGKGWRTKKEVDEAEQFAMGAIIGDFMDDPSVTMSVGQIVIGCIPIVGQVADARDVAAGIYKMWTTGGKDGKLQTAMALIGFIPVLGDGVKAAWKAAKGAGKEAAQQAAKRAFVEAAKGGEGTLAKSLLRNADEVAQAFKLTKEEMHAFTKNLKELGEKAMKEGGPAAAKYVEALQQTLKDLGGNGGALVSIMGGKWAAFARQLKSIPGGDVVGKELQAWRVAQFDQLEKRVAAEARTELAPDLAKRADPPKMERTGTPAVDSDVDVSFLGSNATKDRNAAIRAMEERFGAGWRDLLDADIFADPKRLHLFEAPLGAIGGKAAKAAEKRIVKEAELNVLAKMLKDGADPAVVNKMAKEMGVDMAALAARQKEITNLSKDYLTGMLKGGTPRAEVEKLAKEMGVPMDDVLKNLDHFEDAYRKLEMQMDNLHRQYLDAAGNLPKQAQIAEEMAAVQGKLNAAVPGPYMTPGGGAKHVSRREPKLRGSAGYKAMSPAMGYMAVLDDLYMLKHALPEAGKGFTEKSAKGMAKYGDRLLTTAGQFGVDMGGKSAGPLFNRMAELLAAARRDSKALASLGGELEGAKGTLLSQLDGILQGVKKNADDYLADVATGGAKYGTDVAGDVAKTTTQINTQKALVRAIREPTKDEILAQQKQAEQDNANAGIAPIPM